MNNDEPRQKLSRVLEPIVEDIFALSDEEILAEAYEDGLDLDLLIAEVQMGYAAAMSVAGKHRLSQARAELEAVRSFRSAAAITGLSASEKEQVLRKFAANDNPLQKRLTMAARNGGSLTEAEMDAVLLDLVELGALSVEDPRR